MSAFGGKADIEIKERHVRFKADIDWPSWTGCPAIRRPAMAMEGGSSERLELSVHNLYSVSLELSHNEAVEPLIVGAAIVS